MCARRLSLHSGTSWSGQHTLQPPTPTRHSPIVQSCICFWQSESLEKGPQLFRPEVGQGSSWLSIPAPWRPYKLLVSDWGQGCISSDLQAWELSTLWEEEAGCSPSGHGPPPLPQDKSPSVCSAPGQTAGFSLLSRQSAWTVTPSCPLRGAWHTLLLTPCLMKDLETGQPTWGGRGPVEWMHTCLAVFSSVQAVWARLA